MNTYRLVKAALVIGLLASTVPAFAAEGSAAGNGTSTPAGPAGDNGGPTKTMAPAAGGPAAGAGKSCPTTDQRGKPRKADGCTAGAYELP